MGILRRLIKLVYIYLLKSGIIKKKSFLVNDRVIVLTNIYKSALLKKIAADGFESYENEVVILIKNLSSQINTFVDIGANIGYFSILAELYSQKNTRIIAIEPFPQNAHYMKSIKALNSFSFEIIEKAIDNDIVENKELFFSTHKTSSQLAMTASIKNAFIGSDEKFSGFSYETIKVSTTTLDDVLLTQTESALIKIDAEGNEYNILKSSQTILKRDNVDFIIEIMINDKDKQDIFDIMKLYHYSAYLITNGGLVLEDRPLTFPNPGNVKRTLWRNHFFTKKDISAIKQFSEKYYDNWI